MKVNQVRRKFKHTTTRYVTGVVLTTLVFFFSSCSTSSSHEAEITYSLPDTLKIGTLYSPMSYFRYKDQIMGYDYELIQQLSRDKDIAFDITVAPSVSALIEMLENNDINLAAFDIPLTGTNLEKIIPCGYEHLTSQVLVQKKGERRIKNVTELIGKDIYVEKDSKYLQRLENLNEELGGGINICIVDEDSIISEDLLDKVTEGNVPFTIVDSDVARFNKGYYPGLDMTVQVSFPQKSSWAVSKENKWLADSINSWFETTSPEEANKNLLRRYFELSRALHVDTKAFSKNFSKGYISEYDNLFKQYAKTIGVDWRLLAAIAYTESRFDSSVVSWAGAKGVMQVMPSTAKAFGFANLDWVAPENNVQLSTKIMSSLDNSLKAYVADPQERMKFVIAAYNSGLAHVIDAINIAKAYGYDSAKWDGNVAEALKMKSQPEIYNNTDICRYGYFKGNYTVAYVKNVMNLYGKALASVPNS